MKKRWLLIILCIMILTSAISYAQEPLYSTHDGESFTRTGLETFDTNAVMAVNWTNPNTSDGVYSNSVVDQLPRQYVHKLANQSIQNVSERFMLSINNITNNCYIADYNENNDTISVVALRYTTPSQRIVLREEKAFGTTVEFDMEPDGTWQEITFVRSAGNTVALYVNRTWIGEVSSDVDSNYFTFYRFATGVNVCGFQADNWTSYNTSAIMDPDEAPAVFDSPTVSILFPVNDRLYNNPSPIDINYTFSVDEALQPQTITVFINGTPNATNSNGDNFSVNIGEGTFNLSIEILDNNSQTATDNVNSFKIDRTNPFSNLATVLPNGTVIIQSQNITITAFNSNLFGHNVTLFNSLDEILFSQEDLNVSLPQNSIILPIDVASLSPGTYRVISNQSDDHTANAIPAYGIIHDNNNKMITFNTGDSEVAVQLVDAKKIISEIYTPIAGTVLSISDTKLFDRYTFGFSFSNPAADRYYYKFKIVTDDDIIYRENSLYNGHFVINNANWLDFEPYDVTVTHDGTYYYIEFETIDEEVGFESIGGTNFASDEVTFTIETPTFDSPPFDVQCIFDAVGDCNNNNLDNLTGVQASCSNALSVTFDIYTDGTPEQLGLSGTNITSTTWRNILASQIMVTDGLSINVSATCSNDVGSVFASTIGTIALPAEEETFGIGDLESSPFVKLFITILVMVAVGTILISQIKSKSKS